MLPARFIITAATLAALPPMVWADQLGRQDIAFGYMANTCSGLSNGNGRNPGDAFSMYGTEHDCHAAQGQALNGATAVASSYANGTERTTGDAQGSATWGLLKFASEYSGPNTARFPMAAVTGGWVDHLQIDAVDSAHQGKAGMVAALVHVQGYLQVTGPRSGAAVSVAAFVNDVTFSLGRFSRGISTDVIPSFKDLVIDQVVTLQVPFVFGTRFEWSLFADARTGTVVISNRDVVNTGLSDFGHTVTWQGFGDVTRNGQTVDYRLGSQSGIDWTQAYTPSVPEPGTWTLLATGLVAGMARLRRHRAA